LALSVTPDLEDGSEASSTIVHKVLKFDCNLIVPSGHEDLLFEVRWYIEDKEVAVFQNQTFSELSNTSLSENKWINSYKMGFNVSTT